MIFINRREARELGLKRYFSGAPCKHGHVSERLISNGRCLECDRNSKRDFLSTNRETVQNRKREAYWRDPDSHRKKARVYRASNLDTVRERDRARRMADPEKKIKNDRQSYLKHRERRLARLRWYKLENTHVFRAGEARRRARERSALPSWFGELDALVWLEAAALVRLRRNATGIDWQADHMIPLACRSASGLHVWNNCQVIPAALNNSKKNKLILTEPGEWISHLHQKI